MVWPRVVGQFWHFFHNERGCELVEVELVTMSPFYHAQFRPGPTRKCATTAWRPGWVGPMVQWTRKNHKIGVLAKFPLNQNCDLLGCFRRLLPQTEELPSIALAMDSCTMVESISLHHTHLCGEFFGANISFHKWFQGQVAGTPQQDDIAWLPRCHPQRLEPWFAACA